MNHYNYNVFRFILSTVEAPITVTHIPSISRTFEAGLTTRSAFLGCASARLATVAWCTFGSCDGRAANPNCGLENQAFEVCSPDIVSICFNSWQFILRDWVQLWIGLTKYQTRWLDAYPVSDRITMNTFHGCHAHCWIVYNTCINKQVSSNVNTNNQSYFWDSAAKCCVTVAHRTELFSKVTLRNPGILEFVMEPASTYKQTVGQYSVWWARIPSSCGYGLLGAGS